jgi:hypothetical protein
VVVIPWWLYLQLSMQSVPITIYVVSFEFESHSWRGVFDTTLYDKVGQLFDAGRWFYPGTLASSANTTYLLTLRE